MLYDTFLHICNSTAITQGKTAMTQIYLCTSDSIGNSGATCPGDIISMIAELKTDETVTNARSWIFLRSGFSAGYQVPLLRTLVPTAAKKSTYPVKYITAH